MGRRPTKQNSPRPRIKCIEPYYSQACLKGFSKFWAICSTQSLIVSNFLEKFSIFIERFSKFEQDFQNEKKIFHFSFHVFNSKSRSSKILRQIFHICWKILQIWTRCSKFAHLCTILFIRLTAVSLLSILCMDCHGSSTSYSIIVI